MSGSRDNRHPPNHPEYPRDPNNYARWPTHQKQYYSQTSSYFREWSNEGWNPHSYGGWQNNNNLWPHNQHMGPNNLQRGGAPQFGQYQQRFPNSYRHAGAHFAERSLAHITQTALELTSSNHSTARDFSSQQGNTSSNQCNTAKNSNFHIKSVTDQPASSLTNTRTVTRSNLTVPTIQGSAKIVEKQAVGASNTTTSFMPPNDDLRNKVKASLKMLAATKDQTTTKQVVSAQEESNVPSSPQKQRESRLAHSKPKSVTGSPSASSARHPIRIAAGSQRRASQSNSSSNTTSIDNECNALEGIGVIETARSSSSAPSSDKVTKTSSNCSSTISEATTQDNNGAMSISKDQLNKYIRSMDNNQRRQLVEQPRATISQYMLDHLVKENETARARQLSSLRFRVNSNELEVSSRTETHVMLSDELVEQIKELLANEHKEDSTVTPVETINQPDPEEDEIQFLEPPPKEPPLCIDLDLDDDRPPPMLIPIEKTGPTSSTLDKNPSSITPHSTEINKERESNCISSTVRNVPCSAVVTTASQSVNTISKPIQTIDSTTTRPLSKGTTTTSSVSIAAATTSLTTARATTTTPTARAATTPSVRTTVTSARKDANSTVSSASKSSKSKNPAVPQSTKRSKKKGKTSPEAKKNATATVTKTSTSLPVTATPSVSTSVANAPSSRRTFTSVNPSPVQPSTIPVVESVHVPNLQTSVDKVIDLVSGRSLNDGLEVNLYQSSSQTTCQEQKKDEAQKTAETTLQVATTESRASDEVICNSRNTLKFMLEDLQLQEREGKERITIIDRTIEELQLERKALTSRVLALKERQFELLRSSLSFPLEGNTDESADNQKKSEESVCEPRKDVGESEKMDIDVTSNTQGTFVSPTEAPTQLLNLMQQLGENGVQVSIGDLAMDLPCDSVQSNAASGKKRKRSGGDSTKHLKRKSAQHDAQLVPDQVADKTPESTSASSSKLVPPAACPLPQLPVPPAAIPLPQLPVAIPTEVHKSNQVSGNQNSAVVTDTDHLPPVLSSEPSSSVAPQEKSISNTQKPNYKTLPQTESNENQVTKTVPDPVPKRSTSKGSFNVQLPKSSPVLSAVQTSSSGKSSPLPAAGNELRITNVTSMAPSEATSSSRPVSSGNPQPSSKNPTPGKLRFMRAHKKCVKCIFISGPCIFTSSEDGTVHVYDMETKSLFMRILGHQDPVTWLYVVSPNLPSAKLRTITTAPEYLNHLNLITGSLDAHIRQFSLETGKLMYENRCPSPITSVAGHRMINKLYVGSKDGSILTYNPKFDTLGEVKIKVKAEVICMKIVFFRGKKSIIVAARKMDPIVFDLETEESLFVLKCSIPNISIGSISTYSHYVFCCDNNKRVFTFDTETDTTPQVTNLPSTAVSSFHDGARFLLLGCSDGIVRAVDILRKPTRTIFLPGERMKSLASMKVSGNKMVTGSFNGEVSFREVPKLETLFGEPHCDGSVPV